jgi:hypothetical protein
MLHLRQLLPTQLAEYLYANQAAFCGTREVGRWVEPASAGAALATVLRSRLVRRFQEPLLGMTLRPLGVRVATR